MALDEGQFSLSLNTLYQTRTKVGISKRAAQIQPNIFIKGGTVNIYGSNSATQPASIADMELNLENTAVFGFDTFASIPKWVAIVQDTGTTTELVTTAVNIIMVGAIT